MRLARCAAAAVLLALPMVAGGRPAAATPAAAPAPPPTATPARPIPFQTVVPSTLPLATREPGAHVSPLFAALSLAGCAVVVLLAAVQWLLTRPGRQGWTL